jgi:hypothetical protein
MKISGMFFLAFVLLFNYSWATNYYSSSTAGNFKAGNAWSTSCGGTQQQVGYWPTTKDDHVQICTPGKTITCNSGGTCGNLTISSGTLKVSGGTLTVWGNLTLSGGTLDLSGGTLILYGNFSKTGGTFTHTTGGTFNFGGTTATQTISANSYPIIFYDLAISGNKDRIINGNIQIDRGLTLTSGTLSPGKNTIIFGSKFTTLTTGTGKIVLSTSSPYTGFTFQATSYTWTDFGAILSTSSPYNVGAWTMKSGNTVKIASGKTLVINGTANLGSGGTIDLTNGAHLTINGQYTGHGSWPYGIINVASSSNITIGGSGTVSNLAFGTSSSTYTMNNLTINRSGTINMASNLAVNGTLTTSTGCTLEMGTNKLAGTLAGVANSGTINTQCTVWYPPIPTGKTWGGTIQFNATAGGQTVMAGTYGILNIKNTSNTNTASGAITATTLNTSAGGTLDMATYALGLSNVTNSGTIRTQNTSATPFTAGKTWGGTVIFDGNAAQTIPAPSTFNNLTLDNSSGVNLIGDANVTATLTNNIGSAGLVIKSTSASATGSLLHKNNDVPATIERYIPAVSSSSVYHLVSVPLTQASNPLSGLFMWSYLFEFTASTQTWNPLGVPTNTPLYVNQGYMIYKYPGPDKWETDTTYSFAGPMNNGEFACNVTFPNEQDNHNLVPNPYPSAIDWDAANGWTKDNIYDAIWIWNPTAKNYAAYGSQAGTNGATKYIPVGQSFFVSASAANPVLTMNNDVRVHDNQAFFKNEIVELLRIHSSANSFSDEAIIRFSDGATAAFDGQFDVTKFYGNADAPQLFSVSSDNKELSINSLEVGEGKRYVDLGFKLEASGLCTLNFTGMESFNTDMEIHLKDRITGQTIDVRANPEYTFAHSPENDPMRFELTFNGVTSIYEAKPANQDFFYVDGKLYLNFPQESRGPFNVTVYNINGQTEFMGVAHDARAVVDLSDLATGFHVVRVVSNEYSGEKKIVVK